MVQLQPFALEESRLVLLDGTTVMQVSLDALKSVPRDKS